MFEKHYYQRYYTKLIHSLIPLACLTLNVAKLLFLPPTYPTLPHPMIPLKQLIIDIAHARAAPRKESTYPKADNTFAISHLAQNLNGASNLIFLLLLIS